MRLREETRIRPRVEGEQKDFFFFFFFELQWVMLKESIGPDMTAGLGRAVAYWPCHAQAGPLIGTWFETFRFLVDF